MSRHRTTDKYLPPCVYRKHGTFRLIKRGKGGKLAASLPEALAQYARRTQIHTSGSIPELIDCALAHASSELATNTQSQYRIVGIKRHDEAKRDRHITDEEYAGITPDYPTTKIQWNKSCEKAGVKDVHIHDLRAKSLTNAKRQGLNARALAGHTNEAQTDRYIRLHEIPQAEGPELKNILDSRQTIRQRE